jgi:flavin reductase (DIM6/NTAB) family NADH-FMN oxidoreductase RutF
MSIPTDTRAFRDALGNFATGVTVVTTLCDEGPLGMTANSFASVSLDPPLVLWSPARGSARFAAFEAASHFAVHILAADQIALSNAFATKGLEPFKDTPYSNGIEGTPLFDGCVARFECRHAAGHDGGDHLILVGEVLRFAQWDKPALLYHRGKYETLA